MKNPLLHHQQSPIFLFATILILLINGAQSYADNHLKDIPDFSLDSQAGENVSLSALKGHVILINFWATWCRPCRLEMPAIEKLYSKYKASGLTVLAINIEDARNLPKKMAIDHVTQTMNLSFPILYDSQKIVMNNIESHLLGKNMGIPTSILIDRKGKTRYLHQGYREGDENTYQRIIESLIKETTVTTPLPPSQDPLNEALSEH
ncbi:hypothetical protein AB835_03115 [Candidatus Endobugula sertula]|uniref:Thioredoxin domain-containing protein n=1 Tax=Candidatus Endobugula sertula TaxID=62101 RepID=A0A1D2QSP2_9GAMM|nr:hypothetical protein AB835_03115 [Candidatus Endobugula sertula]